jgi:plastocyanin
MATAAGPASTGRTMAVSVVIAVVVGAIAGFAGGYLARPAGTSAFWSSSPAPRTLDIYLFTGVQGPPFDENAVGQPPDIFIPDNIVMNRGDTVRIHVYNTENATEPVTEHHTFTMTDAAYKAQFGDTAGSGSIDLDAGDTMTITLTASAAGVFRYECTFHPPVMIGWLVVLG